MKESLYGVPKAPIFKETFNSEQTVRNNGGTIETPVTFSNGLCAFTASSKGILYNFVPKLFSVRIKFSNRIINGQDNYLFGSNETTKYVLILANNNIYTGLGSSAATYINGVATGNLGTLTSGEIIVTGYSNYTASNFRIGGKNTVGLGFEGSIELVEIYDYTLTANEVKNLYNNKRNRDLNVYQQDSAVSWFGSGVSGNYCSTPNAAANQITGDIEIIAHEFTLNSLSTDQTFVAKDNISFRCYNLLFVGTDGGKIYFGRNIGGTWAYSTSTVASGFALNTKYWVKANRNATTGDVKIFTSTDGINYTQLGATISSTAGNLTTGNLALEVGCRNNPGLGSELPFQGKIGRITISNSIGGTPVVDFNPQLQTPNTTSWVSVTGETWTVNGSAKVTNIDRQEILNIDAKNGVIANKYSNGGTIPNIINTSVVPVKSGSIYAMGFNGVSSRLDCGNYDSLVGDISVIAWAKNCKDGSDSYQAILTNGRLRVYPYLGGSPNVRFNRDGSTTANSSNVPIGSWFQVIITSTSTGVTNIYINGVLNGSANQSAGTPTTGIENIAVGYINSTRWKGGLNQIRIVNGILSAEEISQLFSNERKNYNV